MIVLGVHTSYFNLVQLGALGSIPLIVLIIAIFAIIGFLVGFVVPRPFGKDPKLSTVEDTLDEAFRSLDDPTRETNVRKYLGVDDGRDTIDSVLEQKSVVRKVKMMANFAVGTGTATTRLERIQSEVDAFYSEYQTTERPSSQELSNWNSMDITEQVATIVELAEASEPRMDTDRVVSSPDDKDLGTLAAQYRSIVPDDSSIANLFDAITSYDGSESARQQVQNAFEDVAELAEPESSSEEEGSTEDVAQRINEIYRELYGEFDGDSHREIRRIANDVEDGSVGNKIVTEAADIAASRVNAQSQTARKLLTTLRDEQDVDKTVQVLVDAVNSIDRDERLASHIETIHESIYGSSEVSPESMTQRLVDDSQEGIVKRSGFEKAVSNVRKRQSPTTTTATSLLDVLETDSPDRDTLTTAVNDAIRIIEQCRPLDRELETVRSERELRSWASKIQPGKLNDPVASTFRAQIDSSVVILDEESRPDRLNRFEVEVRLELVEELIEKLSQGLTYEEMEIDQRMDELSAAISNTKEEYLNNPNYGDYNHIIPEHFFRLVESFVERAAHHSQRGNEDIARGFVIAGTEALKHTRELYTTQEYSELLRTLDRRKTECPNCGHHLYG